MPANNQRAGARGVAGLGAGGRAEAELLLPGATATHHVGEHERWGRLG